MDLAFLSPLVYLAWLLGAVAFVLGLVRMNSPATARNGNLLSAGEFIRDRPRMNATAPPSQNR